MKEYIERAPLMNILTCSEMQAKIKSETGAEAYSTVLTIVNCLDAADVVEVVKCKDCRWYDDPFSDDFVCMLPVKLPDGLKYPRKEAMPPYGFCSKGERRVGND